MAKGTKVLPEPTKTAASSASGAVRKDAPPLHTKQAFELTWFIAAWSVFSVITFLAVLDRFTTNVSPRQHFAIEHGWAACEKLKPYGNGTETKMGSACGTDYFCGSEEQFELNKGEMPAAVRPPSRLAFLFCAFLKCSTHLGKRVRDIPTRLLVLLIGRVCVGLVPVDEAHLLFVVVSFNKRNTHSNNALHLAGTESAGTDKV